MKNTWFSACASVMAFLLMMTHIANAQNLTVTGHVSDDLGDVIGASVMVKGTQNGTITDLNGAFTLQNVAPDATVIVSFVGYKDSIIPVKGKQFLKVVMKADAQLLSEVEVVAVGYGDVRRRDLTGSISKPDVNDLIKTPVNNIAQALGGRVAGVSVTSGDGGLDENYNFVIRGAGSLTQDTSPLFVIDGFPSESSGMSSLNPNDIKSIDFLKDASATAIYGSRGANGVVIITTKSGASSDAKAEVTYNGSVTVSELFDRMEMMNGYDFVLLQKEVMRGQVIQDKDGKDIPAFDYYYLQDGKTLDSYKTMPSYDWQDEVYRTAVSHSHHVNISGGNKGFNYSASVGYSDRQGIIIASNLKKYQGRFNFSQKVKNFTFTGNANYSSNVQNGANPAKSGFAASTSLIYSIWAYRPVSPSGDDLLDSLYDEDVDMENDYRFNPVKSARNEYRKNVTNNLSANIGVQWEIIKNLKLKVTAGYTGRDNRKEEFNGRQTRTGNDYPSNTQSKGINARLIESENRSYLNENTLTYSLHKKRHNFNALLGLTFQKSTSKYNSIATEHILNESFGMSGLDKGAAPKVESAVGENAMMSYFARFNYNYGSRYYVTVSMRADGSSKFAPKNRWGYFPSASVAWAFAREKFIKDNASWLSNGKLRFSWGLTGNNRIGNFDYLSRVVTDRDMYKYPFNNGFLQGMVMSGIANPELKWETTEQYDLGLDLGFFNGRINLSLDYYLKNTHDLLLDADVSMTSGYSTAMVNVGKLRNHGLELSLETINIKSKGFQWTSNLNFSFNFNKILALNSGQKDLLSFVDWDSHYANAPAYISTVGQAAGRMYGFNYLGTYKYEDFDILITPKGEYKYTPKEGIPTLIGQNARPGDPRYEDINHDNVIDDKDRTVIGNGQPLFIGGFGNTFTYRHWDLNVFLQWSYGNDIYNINRLEFENPQKKKNKNQFASYKNRWSETNPYSDMVRADANGAGQYSSLYVEDGSYLKLKNISLGYTFTKKLLGKSGINSLRLYFSAENIATLTSYSGADPEVSTRHSILTPGFDWSAYPRSFNASLGLSLTF